LDLTQDATSHALPTGRRFVPTIPNLPRSRNKGFHRQVLLALGANCWKK